MHADLERRLRETRPDLTPPAGTRERLAGRLGIQGSRARGPYAWLGGRRRGVALLAGAVLVTGTAVGTAVVALRSGGTGTVRVADQPEGSWTRAEPLSVRFLNEYPEPVVAVDDHGRALVAWERAGRIEIRTRSASGGWEPVRVASTAERATDPVVAVSPGGRGQVIWRERRGGRREVLPLVGPDGRRFGQLRRKAGVRYVIAARSIDLNGGALGPIRTVSQPTQRQGDMQQLSAGADARGRVSVAWARLNALEVAGTDTDGRWGAPLRMRSTGGAAPWRLNLSVERDGHRAVIWHSVAQTGPPNAMMVATGTSEGWAAPTQLDQPRTYNGDTPVITIDRRGRAWAIWNSPQGGGQRLSWAVLDQEGWSEPRPLTNAADGTTGAPGIATSGDGTAVAVWGQAPGNFLGGPRGTTHTAVLPVTGPARAPGKLSQGTVVLQSRQGTPITADGSGRVIAVSPEQLGIAAFTWRAGRASAVRTPVSTTAGFWTNGRARIAGGRDGTLVGVASRSTPGGERIVAYTRSPEAP